MSYINNLITFTNIIIIACFYTSSIDSFISVSKDYNGLTLVVSIYILFLGLCLSALSLNFSCIDDVFNSNNNVHYIIAAIEFIGGFLMLGMNNVSCIIGIFSILASVLNLLYAICPDTVYHNNSDESESLNNN